MRIEKRVRSILKQEITTLPMVADEHAEEAVSFDGWFKDLVHEVLGEPAIDAIFATYGLNAGDEIEGVSFLSELTEWVEESREFREVGGRLRRNIAGDALIQLDVPLHDYMAGTAREMAKSILIHEIEHYARHRAGLLETSAHAQLKGVERNLAALDDPQEQTAIKAQIFDLIETGLNDHEILTTLLDQYGITGKQQPEDIPKVYLILFHRAEQMLARLIEEAKQEYADFITVR